MLEHLTASDFTDTAPYVAEVPGREPVSLALVETEAKGSPRPFSVVLSGPLEPELGQGMYALTHPTFDGPLEMFMVPIARDADAMRYQIIFG